MNVNVVIGAFLLLTAVSCPASELAPYSAFLDNATPILYDGPDFPARSLA